MRQLRTSNTGIKSIDDVFETLNYKVVDNHITANGVKLHTVETLLRRGDIMAMFSKLNKPSAITLADEIRFRKMLNTPDVKVRNLEETIKSAKIIHPDLDINVGSVSDLERLPKSSKAKLTNIMDNLWTSVKTGTAAVGLFAAIALGVPYFESLVAATAARNGFYVVVAINNTTRSYKVTSRSCINSNLNGKLPYSGTIELDNVALYLLYVINNKHDDEERAKVVDLIDGTAPTMDNFESILSNEKWFKKLTDYYYSSSFTGPKNIKNPCDLIPQADKANVPCVAWDTSASATSYTYYNPYNLPDNMSFQCITNSTILETIVDAAGDAAHYILNSTFITKLGSYIKYIILGVLIVVGVIVARFVYVKFKSFNGGSGGDSFNDDDDDAEQPLMEYEEYDDGGGGGGSASGSGGVKK